MRRKRAFIYIILLLLLIRPVYSRAEGTALRLTTSPGSQGETVKVSVNLSDGASPAMIQFCLGFDTEKADYVGAWTGSALAKNTAPSINSVDGKIYFAWDSLTPLTGGGALLEVELRPVSEDATVWIDFDEEFVFADETFKNIDIAAETSSVALGAGEQQTEAEPAATEEPVSGYNDGLTLDDNELVMKPGASAKLKPRDQETGLDWLSSNESVATVNEGKITAVTPGTALITVVSEDGTKEAACLVTVTNDVPAENIGQAPAAAGTPAWIWIAAGCVAAVAAGAVITVVVKKHNERNTQRLREDD